MHGKEPLEYVKEFEADDSLLPHCWIVVRIDGKGFTKYAVTPMNISCARVLEVLADDLLAAGFQRIMALRSPTTQGHCSSWTSAQWQAFSQAMHDMEFSRPHTSSIRLLH